MKNERKTTNECQRNGKTVANEGQKCIKANQLMM